MDGVAPAVGNAVLDASLYAPDGLGVHINENPVTPEKVWRAFMRPADQASA